MKILLSKSIEKDFLKIIISKKSLKFLIEKIKKQNIESIYLKRPFVKIKISIFWLTLRIIGEYRKINWILILILIFKKNCKKNWENIFWSKDIDKKIKNTLKKISKDIQNKDFDIY